MHHINFCLTHRVMRGHRSYLPPDLHRPQNTIQLSPFPASDVDCTCTMDISTVSPGPCTARSTASEQSDSAADVAVPPFSITSMHDSTASVGEKQSQTPTVDRDVAVNGIGHQLWSMGRALLAFHSAAMHNSPSEAIIKHLQRDTMHSQHYERT